MRSIPVASPNEVIVHVLKQDAEEILAYWTPERRAAAVPRDLSRPIVPRSGRRVPELGAEPGLQLHPEWPEPEFLPKDGPITKLVGNIRKVPFRAVGKVYFLWK